MLISFWLSCSIFCFLDADSLVCDFGVVPALLAPFLEDDLGFLVDSAGLFKDFAGGVFLTGVDLTPDLVLVASFVDCLDVLFGLDRGSFGSSSSWSDLSS